MMLAALAFGVMAQTQSPTLLQSMENDGLFLGRRIDQMSEKAAIGIAISNAEIWAKDGAGSVGMLVMARSYFPRWKAVLGPGAQSNCINRLAARIPDVLEGNYNFPDIPNNRRFHVDMLFLYDAGLLNGTTYYLVHSYRGGRPDSRVEFAGWTYAAFRSLETMPNSNPKYRECLVRIRRLCELGMDIYQSQGIDGAYMAKNLDDRLRQTSK
ncbi:hypothetical protein BH11ARM1_BH11ARM1_01320 [soil metagenome]